MISFFLILLFRFVPSGRKIYEPPRFMTVAQAAEQLVTIIERKKEEGKETGNSLIYIFFKF